MALCQLDHHKAAHDEEDRPGDVSDQILAEVKVLVSHDVERGEQSKGRVEREEGQRRHDQQEPPRRLQEALTHDP